MVFFSTKVTPSKMRRKINISWNRVGDILFTDMHNAICDSFVLKSDHEINTIEIRTVQQIDGSLR